MKSTPLLLILFALMPASSKAQTTPGAAPDTALINTLRDAQSHSRFVRLSAPDTIEGRVTDVTTTEVRIIGKPRIAIADITRLQVRERKGGGMWPAGFFGAIVGGLSMAAMFAGVSDQPHHSVSFYALPFGIGAGLGGTIGVFLGSVIDHPRETWRDAWSR